MHRSRRFGAVPARLARRRATALPSRANCRISGPLRIEWIPDIAARFRNDGPVEIERLAARRFSVARQRDRVGVTLRQDFGTERNPHRSTGVFDLCMQSCEHHLRRNPGRFSRFHAGDPASDFLVPCLGDGCGATVRRSLQADDQAMDQLVALTGRKQQGLRFNRLQGISHGRSTLDCA